MSKFNKEDYDYELKLLILGDAAVGKSDLLLKFVNDHFMPSHITTICVDYKEKNITVDDIKYKLRIWDTAGQEKYRSIVKTYYKGAMGIILLYSVEDARSFQNIEDWMEQIAAAINNETVVLLVGNKADVEEREVLKEDGEKLARDYNITFLRQVR